MKEFNIIVTGIGGHGVLTLETIIAEAAMREGYDLKTSELHGLAQRGGTISTHIRFGEKIYSPLVLQGEANVIIALEPLEALRAAYYGSKEHGTVFLTDSYRVTPLSVFVSHEHYPSNEEIVNTLHKFSKKVMMINASDAVMKETGDNIATNIYMLGYAVAEKLIPLKKENVIEAMRSVFPEKHFEVNRKIFEMGLKH